MSERSLGGSGDLNLPYEEVPGGPVHVTADFLIASGVIIRAATLEHPVTKRPHPALLYTFALPDGTTTHAIALIVEEGELAALEGVTRDAIRSARKAARKAGHGTH